MLRKRHLLIAVVFALAALTCGALLLREFGGFGELTVLRPKGFIASEQFALMRIAFWLMLIVAVPVFVMTGWFAWRYRASNRRATYKPDWDSNLWAETVWWGVPCVIILILATLAWRSSHDLDPFKALASDKKPITVQVVALQWKWLFIYPDYGIATVNYLQFPEDTPVNFQITADAPMNSFWIPALGGQVYAMSGMETRLHLMASEPGSFAGSSANLSGEGFADMRFTARASSEQEFARWVQFVRRSPNPLSMEAYHRLAKPGTSKQVGFSVPEKGLFAAIVRQHMAPAHTMGGHE